MRKPSLRQLEAFKAFVESGSVSRAADVLHVSQPAVSKLLNHFEADIGMQLIDRNSNRPVVTERGIRVYEEIDRVLSGVDQVGQAIASIRAKERSLITIGVMPGFPPHILSHAAQLVRNERPDVSISFIVRSSEYVSHGILSRQMDLGIIARNLDHPQVNSTLFSNDSFVAVMSRDHQFASQSTVNVTDLHGQHFIAFTQGSVTRRLIDEAMEAAKVEADIILQATTAPNCCAFVEAGLGLCVMSPLFAKGHLRTLVARPFVPNLSLKIQTVHHVDSRDKRAIALVLNALKEARDYSARTDTGL